METRLSSHLYIHCKCFCDLKDSATVSIYNLDAKYSIVSCQSLISTVQMAVEGEMAGRKALD